MHGQTQVELWISSVFCVLFVLRGTKIDDNGVPGRIREQVGLQTLKKTKSMNLDFRFGRVFWRHFGIFREVIF